MSDPHGNSARWNSGTVATLIIGVIALILMHEVSTANRSTGSGSSSSGATQPFTSERSAMPVRPVLPPTFVSRRMHIQYVVVGDSTASSTNSSVVSRGSPAEFAEALTEALLAGRVVRPDALRRAAADAQRMLDDPQPLTDAAWPRILDTVAQRTSDFPRCRQNSNRTCVTSVGSATLALLGHSTLQFGVVMEECLAKRNVHAVQQACTKFLAQLQADLQRATTVAADEVLFVVVVTVGINNMVLRSMGVNWDVSDEGRRVISLTEVLVGHLVGDANCTAEPFPRQQPIFPFSFSRRRTALVFASELPHVWFFPMQAHGVQVSMTQNATTPFSNGGGFAPSALLCGQYPSFEAAACALTCAWFTAQSDVRRAGLKEARQLNHAYVRELSLWDRRIRALGDGGGSTEAPDARALHVGSPESPAIVIERDLLPLRRATAGNCEGSGLCDNGKWLLDHRQQWFRNFHDCIHLFTYGARRQAVMIVIPTLRFLQRLNAQP